MTRDFSAARNATGNTVPSVIGTSPKRSPGRRSPTTRSIPSMSLIASMRPSSTAKSARSPPSSTAFSPGIRLISAATRQSRSRSPGFRSAKTVTPPISSAVTMYGGAPGRLSRAHGSRSATRQKRPKNPQTQRDPTLGQPYCVASVPAVACCMLVASSDRASCPERESLSPARVPGGVPLYPGWVSGDRTDLALLALPAGARFEYWVQRSGASVRSRRRPRGARR